MIDKYKEVSSRIFGGSAERIEDRLGSLETGLRKSNLGILRRTYVSVMLMTSFLSFVGMFLATSTFFLFLNYSPLYVISMGLVVAVASSVSVFMFMYLYPVKESRSRSKSIRNNLPFAINHMSAIASSRVPPYVIFKLLAEFDEYGEISTEARKIVRDVDVFGHDITTALKQASIRTPSDEFQEFLGGLVSIEETGGSLIDFLEVQAEEAMFDYRQMRKRYMDALSTYADFYTAVLIAAPLLMVAVLSVMSMVGGEVFGMEIRDAISLGIYGAIPLMNVIFISFIHLTQPEVV